MDESAGASDVALDDPWSAVPGQPAAVARLQAAVANPVHAYLFVGPEGTGKRAALRTFAGELFAAEDPAHAERHRRLTAAAGHPDLVVVEPEGAIFRGGRAGPEGETEAAIIRREAHRSPTEAPRRVVAADHFDAANEAAIGSLLKTIEEPPERTIVVLLAERVPPEQSAIASRCVRIDFASVDSAALRALLVAEGVAPDRAELAATVAAGSVTRARLLATDERLSLRIAAWAAVPGRLDGTGATATQLVADLRAMLDDAQAPVAARHEAELTAFDAEVSDYGLTSVTGRRNALKARHKRTERQSRMTEIRLGLTVMAREYRDAAVTHRTPGPLLAAVDRIGATSRAFAFSPNEELALTALFWKLPSLGHDG